MTPSKHKYAGHAAIDVFSNEVSSSGQPTGQIVPNYAWHSDGYEEAIPYRASLMYIAVSPPSGGETYFLSLYESYQQLQDPLQRLLINYRYNFYNSTGVTLSQRPAVLTNPYTKQKSLYICSERGSQTQCKYSEMNKYFYDHSIKSSNKYKYLWQAGDLVIWDNFSVMHCPGVPTKNARTHYRTVVKNPQQWHAYQRGTL